MLLSKAIALIEDELCGTCNYFDTAEAAEKYGVEELELAQAMDDAEIFLCSTCGWWQYPGEYCGMHDHDEIICTDCCEEK